MQRKGFSISVEDMFSHPLTSNVAHATGPDDTEITGRHNISYDVAHDVFIFSDFKGEDFEDWNGEFYLSIYTRIHPMFRQSSYEGKLVVPGDIIRTAIKAGWGMHIGKQHEHMRTPGNW